jgi:hypothetical protein
MPAHPQTVPQLTVCFYRYNQLVPFTGDIEYHSLVLESYWTLTLTSLNSNTVTLPSASDSQVLAQVAIDIGTMLVGGPSDIPIELLKPTFSAPCNVSDS